jgi:outer membrane receptor protein involved in Fe transport
MDRVDNSTALVDYRPFSPPLRSIVGMSGTSTRSIFVALFSALAASTAAAQQPATAQQGSADADQLEEVVIVGSQIRGAKVTEVLPVTVVDKEEIDATAAVSGDDLFRSIPQAGDVQFQEARTTGNLNDARGDTSSVNLRSLGTGNTLMLLNGRRVVPAPGTQTENFVPVQTANTNAFPVAGVQRVEVLRDGAAAIYGTDAVAGVVNTVLETDYEGLRVEAQYGGSEGTPHRETTINLKGGTQFDNGMRVAIYAGFYTRNRLLATDRDYSASEDHRWRVADTPWAGDTSFDNRSTSSPWGSFTVIPSTVAVRQGTVALTTSGVFRVEPTSNTAAGCSSTVYNGNLCLRAGTITGAVDRELRYNENVDRTLKGGVDRYNAFATVSREFGDLEFFGEAGLYKASFSGLREQSAPLATAVISVPASNHWNPFGATTINGVANPNRLPNLVNVPVGGLPLRITTYRPVDTGPRVYEVTDDSYRLLAGLRGERFGFDWETAIVHSWAKTDDHTTNAVSNTLFQRALARSTPDAYNPFNGGNQGLYSGPDTTLSDRATIDSFLVGVNRISETTLTMWDLKASRNDIATLPAGDVGLAGGLEVRRESYSDDRDERLDGTIKYTDAVTNITYGTDVMGASPSPDVRAHRSVVSAYLELGVPLVSPEMQIPLVRSIDMQLAVRTEDYSDFGSVTKPKLALNWSIAEWLALRGSVSQGFRAPNLPQFYSSGTQVSNTRTDFSFCRLNNVTCSGASTIEVRSGNQGLGPEEADNLSAGIILRPTFLPDRAGDVTLTVDYWSIEQTDVIGIEGGQIQMLYDYLLRLDGQSNPNLVRDPPVGTNRVGQLLQVNDNYFNITPREIAGFDASLRYDLKQTAIGSFSFTLNAAKLTKFEQSPTEMASKVIEANNAGRLGPGIVITAAGNQIGVNGNPEWRGSASLTWRQKQLRAGLFVNHVGSVNDTGPAAINGQLFEVDSWTTVSLYGQYDFRRREDFLDRTSLRLGVRNIADKDPPLTSTNFGYFGSLANATGRYVYATLSKSF